MSRPSFTPHPVPDCPSRETLLSFFQGELEATDELAGHLETCSACQQTLDQLASTTSLELRGPAPAPWLPTADLLQQMEDLSRADSSTTNVDGPLPAIAGYRLIGILGQGGMGVVYEGVQENLGRYVALKTLRADKVNDELRARLQREAEAIARLNHANIVQIYEVGEWQPPAGGPALPYLAMERVFGKSLGQWLAGQPQSAERAADFAAIMARAIHAAHQAGIVHRDLKPSNVLVQMAEPDKAPAQDAAPVLKITDFGLAKDVEAGASLTETGEVVGTPNYMAPEQAHARLEEIGPAADIYALGALLYEMLTSRPPFVGKTPLEVLMQVIAADPLAPRQLLPAIPRDLDTICMKCLEKEPRRRYASAAHLADDLARFLAGEPILARPLGPITRAARWCRRKPGVAAVWGLAASLLLGAGAAGFWYQHDRAVRATEELSRRADAQRKHDLAERGMADALEQAREIRARLEKELHQAGGVALLLNDPRRWSAPIDAAKAALERAVAIKGGADGPVDGDLLRDLQLLADHLQRDEADRLLALRLEKIRLDRSTWVDGGFDNARALREYPDVFEQAGLCLPPDVRGGAPRLPSAGLLQQSAIREQLLAALDDWAFAAVHAGRQQLATQLLAVARTVDPDPWRDRIRGLPGERWVREELADQALADEAVFSTLSPAFLELVGQMLRAPATTKPTADTDRGASNQKAVQWLRHAQMRHPADFWLNFDLASVLLMEQPIDAAGYYRTALAVRRHSGAAWNNLGVALRQQKDFPAARHALLKAVEAEPGNAFAWTTLGLNLLDQHDVPAAIAACRKAVECEPRVALAWNNLGLALSRSQDQQGALSALRKAIELEPKFAKAWYNLGNVLYSAQDRAGARTAYETALSCAPRYDLPWLGLGNLLQDENKLGPAVAAFKRALELEPRRAMTWYNLGNALRLQKDHADAAVAYRKAVEIEPTHVRAWRNLGVALLAGNDVAGSIEATRKALALDRKHVGAWINLGIAFYRQRDWPAAADAYRKALEAEPKHAGAWYHLGNVLDEQDDLLEATAAYKKAIEHDPKHASAWNNLGLVYLQQQDLPAARAAFKSTVGIAPNHNKAWVNLGRVYDAEQDYPNAAAAFRKALEFEANNAGTWTDLGAALRKQNRLPEAAAAYQQAIALKPELSKAHTGLGLVYRDQGRFAEAVAATKKGLALTSLLEAATLVPQLYECEKLLALEQRLPLVLQGEKTTPMEQLALAELCDRYKQRPADAVRLYGAAFSGQPSLAADATKNHRTRAACAAVRAAAARAGEAGEPSRLRDQALAWLSAELAAGTARVQADPPPELTALRDKLAQWRRHADLASVREPDALGRLPEGDQKAWRGFWSAVEQLERAIGARPR